MKRMRLALMVTSSVVVIACGSTDAEIEALNPAPSEATVFAATEETKNELGIAKWGFAADEEGDLATYRGYGEKNDVLVTVEQRVERSDEDHWRFTMTASGAKGTAVVKIEFERRTNEVEMLVTENSFDEGGTSARVLARFKADGAARVFLRIDTLPPDPGTHPLMVRAPVEIDINGDVLVLNQFSGAQIYQKSGRPLPLGKWICLEWELSATASTVWVDGEVQIDVKHTFETPSSFGIGVEYNQVTTASFTVLYDELAIAPTRIGCR